MRWWLASLLTISIACPVEAQVASDASAADIAQARGLFAEGVQHLRAGRWPEACAVLDRSHALVETAQTHLNLSVCTGEMGRTLDQSEHLRAFLRLAGPSIDPELITRARAQLAEAEPRIPHVVIRPRPADARDVEITVDGEVLPREAWGTERPVNPGRITIVASGSAWEAYQTTLPVRAGARVEVPVPLTARPTAPARVETPSRSEDAGDGGDAAVWVIAIVGVAVAIAGLSVAIYFLAQPQTSDVPLDVDWRREALRPTGVTLLRF